MKAGWEEKLLGEVCELVTRGIAPKYLDKGGIRVINQKCIRNHKIDFRLSRRNDTSLKRVPEERLIQVGDVLINSTGTGTLGRVAQVREIPSEPTTVDTHVTIVRPISSKFYDDFFGYCLIEIEKQLIDAGQGSVGQTELSKRDIQTKFKIKYPTDNEEQRRIVAILDETFEGLETAQANAEANLASAEELFESQLDFLLTSDETQFVEMPLIEIGTVQTGNTPPSSDPSNFGDFMPFITPGDFSNDGSLRYENRGLSKKGTALSRQIEAKSALMVCIGATIGKPAFTVKEIVINQQINAVTPKKDIMAEFLYFQFLSRKFQKSVLENAGQTTLPIINKTKWSGLNVSIPKDKELQLHLLQKLKLLRSETLGISQKYRRNLGDIDQLRQSLLQKAFAGELT